MGDFVGGATFDLVTLEHEHHLAVLHQRDARDAGAVAGEVAAGGLRRFRILTGEHRHALVRLRRMFERGANRWTRVARRAAAHAVDHHQRRAGGFLQCGIDSSRGLQFLHTELGQLGTHRGNETLIVHRPTPAEE